jgi:hypothetical protein
VGDSTARVNGGKNPHATDRCGCAGLGGERLLDRTFQELGFFSFGSNLPVQDFGVLLEPDITAAERRLVLGQRLGMNDCIRGHIDVSLERWVGIDPCVASFGRRSEEAGQPDCVGRLGRISNDPGY